MISRFSIIVKENSSWNYLSVRAVCTVVSIGFKKLKSIDFKSEMQYFRLGFQRLVNVEYANLKIKVIVTVIYARACLFHFQYIFLTQHMTPSSEVTYPVWTSCFLLVSLHYGCPCFSLHFAFPTSSHQFDARRSQSKFGQIFLKSLKIQLACFEHDPETRICT